MKKKLVIVERDKDILQVISIIFKDQGYHVVGRQSEEGILDVIAREQPNAVLLDIIKPTLEGTSLCRAIKAAEKTKHIPVIVLSTHVKFEQLKEVCADEVLGKPFDLDELLEAVNGQLDA